MINMIPVTIWIIFIILAFLLGCRVGSRKDLDKLDKLLLESNIQHENFRKYLMQRRPNTKEKP